MVPLLILLREKSKETLLKNAEIALRIENFDLAKENFEILTKRYPDEYKGWWGLIQNITKNFTYYDLSIDELNQFYSYSIKLGSDNVIVELKKQYKEYLYSYAKSRLRLQYLTLNKTKQEYSESYDQIKEKIEDLDKKHNNSLEEFNEVKHKYEKNISDDKKTGNFNPILLVKDYGEIVRKINSINNEVSNIINQLPLWHYTDLIFVETMKETGKKTFPKLLSANID